MQQQYQNVPMLIYKRLKHKQYSIHQLQAGNQPELESGCEIVGRSWNGRSYFIAQNAIQLAIVFEDFPAHVVIWVDVIHYGRYEIAQDDHLQEIHCPIMKREWEYFAKYAF